MNKVTIVTDSVSCIPKEMTEQYGIRIVPAGIIHFEGKTYRDGVDLGPTEAYDMIEKAPDRFCSSAVSPAEFYEVYRDLSEQSESILCITLSSKLSAVHSAARLAREQATADFPQTVIEVFDSNAAAGSEGLIALAAARAAAEGKSIAEVLREASRIRDRVKLACVMGTIRYAYRSGRIPKIAARVGSTLNIKPIFTIDDGSARTIAVVRNKKKGTDRTLQMIRDTAGTNPIRVAVMHASVPEEGESLIEQISSEFNCVEILLTEFSPIMGYSTGPGVLGVAFYPED